ncbi:MerR family transcriptional regulator [uncultured Clostridium sp.]|uniref:MerR family transcriptional regulator n=1 Tax=uncultured Clostridium sp. TaxID=59620 RepID=UPI002628F588|nr:MerR family transcriptional regulator [uncultured Clostridium sp.]
MKEYYKIGEISKIYNIGKDSLMYYEKLGILNPIRDENSYRLYSINDIWRLNLVKELRELNFSMKRIKEYIDNRTLKSTKELLNEEINILDRKIEEFKKKKEEVEKRLSVIEEDFEVVICNEIKVKNIKERKSIILNGQIKRDEETDFLIKKLHKKFEGRFNMLGNNNIGAMFSLDKLKVGEYDFYKSVFCFLGEEDIEDIDYSNMSFNEGLYISYTYKGEYSKKKKILKEMFDYIEENNFKIKSEPIEIYKVDIHETGDLKEFITELQIEVEEI